MRYQKALVRGLAVGCTDRYNATSDNKEIQALLKFPPQNGCYEYRQFMAVV